MNPTTIAIALEADQQQKTFFLGKIEGLSNMLVAERQVVQDIKDGCCDDCKVRISGNIKDGFKFTGENETSEPGDYNE